MNKTDELFFEMIETYQRHAQAARSAKYQETREMAEILLNMDIAAMWSLTQQTRGTRCRLMLIGDRAELMGAAAALLI